MASTGQLWWITPLQVLATLGPAINFGGSALQSPLIMPMLQLADVPAQYSGVQTAYLLHNSEHFFPPLNAVCTLANLVSTVTTYLYGSGGAQTTTGSSKLRFFAAGLALNMATTAYALLIMVPMNRRMAVMAGNLQANAADEKSEKELRTLQKRWQGLNYGRAVVMLTASLVGMAGLLSPL